MRIALFTECYRPIVNGVVVSVVTFAEELAKQGHEVQIIAPAYPGYRDSEPHVYRLPSVSPPTDPRYPIALPFGGAALRRALAADPPDIVHLQHPFALCRRGRRWARQMRRPLVFTYHTLIRAYAHYIPLPRPLVQWAAVWVSREFSNSVDHVIAPTQAVADVLRGYGVHRPITVIPTGVDVDLIRGTERKPVRREYGIPDGVPVVAYSGRVAREKSVDVLVRAFALAVERHREARLLLVGGGPWQDACHELAGSLGIGERVHCTGFLDRTRVFDCIADSDVFAFASLTDTQGVAVLEAMALGCPPVAVDSGAVADVIRDGIDGLVVDGSPAALAEGLIGLLDSDRLRRRLAGQARARAEEFSAGRMAERLTRVYDQLLGSCAAREEA